MNRLDEIAARAEAATQGPWEVRNCPPCTERGRLEVNIWDTTGNFLITSWCDDDDEPGPDAEFIAHAREDVPRLVAALRAVEAVVSERYKLWAAICGETCGKEVYGIDHDAIADSIAATIETAIREALGS